MALRRIGRLAGYGRLRLDGPDAERRATSALIEPVFFTTSNAGGKAPAQALNETRCWDAHDIDALKRCDVVVTAQGGDFTKRSIPALRATGWKGYWIDAAKTLRMNDDGDRSRPGQPAGDQAALRGVRDFIGGTARW